MTITNINQLLMVYFYFKISIQHHKKLYFLMFVVLYLFYKWDYYLINFNFTVGLNNDQVVVNDVYTHKKE